MAAVLVDEAAVVVNGAVVVVDVVVDTEQLINLINLCHHVNSVPILISLST